MSRTWGEYQLTRTGLLTKIQNSETSQRISTENNSVNKMQRWRRWFVVETGRRLMTKAMTSDAYQHARWRGVQLYQSMISTELLLSHPSEELLTWLSCISWHVANTMSTGALCWQAQCKALQPWFRIQRKQDLSLHVINVLQSSQSFLSRALMRDESW